MLFSNECVKNTYICTGCYNIVSYDDDEIYIDDHGYGYSTKLVKCKVCKKIHVIEYLPDRQMDEKKNQVNFDERYYDYRR